MGTWEQLSMANITLSTRLNSLSDIDFFLDLHRKLQ